MRPLTRVTPGQPFQPAAADWNAFIDAARAHRGAENRPRLGNLPDFPAAANQVLVRNDHTSDLNRFDILEISGLIATPDDNLTTFLNRPVFAATQPTVRANQIVITAAPIPAGRIGPAILLGLTPVEIYVPTGAQQFAYAETTTSWSALRAAPAGPATILYLEYGGLPAENFYWGLVSLSQIPPTPTVIGTTAGIITGGGFGVVNVYSDPSTDTTFNITAYNDWLLAGTAEDDITLGQTVICTYFPNERKWRITGAACEA